MRTRTPGIIITLLAAAVSAGCAVLSLITGPPREIPFPHAAHIKAEMTCEICHSGAESEDRAGMPNRDVCITCHDIKPDRAPRAFEKKIVELQEIIFPILNKPGDLIFSHAKHAAKGYKCADCHGSVEALEETDDSVIATMDACIACHSREQLSTKCADCHTTIREDARPATHDAVFLSMHGGEIRGSDDALERGKCNICHGTASARSCDQCHAETPPANHNEFWRRRGHGFSAELDRENCATCHREDSCIRCHTTVTPASHAGAFGGTFSSHCYSCHEPLAANTCFACHPSNPSHALAPPKPPPPHTGANVDCRTCHLPNLLIHADNGQNCNICHH